MATFRCCNALLVVVYCLLMPRPSSSTKAHIYLSTPFVASIGKYLCAVNTPSTVMSTIEGKVRCGVQCTITSCTLYQFKTDSAQCELFNNLPLNFTNIDDCTPYVVSPAPDAVSSSDTTIVSLLSIGNVQTPVLSINSWIVIHNKVREGSSWTSFNQSWIAYRNGFGDLSLKSNYWIGNELIYILTNSRNYQLKVEVTFTDNSSMSVIYSSFSISPETTQYTLSVSGYNGNGAINGDAFPAAVGPSGYVSNGMKFTTLDRDHDLMSNGNCANSGGGWWYKVCSQSTLNRDTPGNWYRLRAVQSSRMAIQQN